MQPMWLCLFSGRQFEVTFEKKHIEEKSNKYNQCEFGCSDPSSLRSHMKLHSGGKSNKCNQCTMCTLDSFFPFDRERWDTLSNLETVILLNIYLSQRSRSKGTMRKLDFREPQTLNLWFSLKYSPVVTTKYAPLFPCYSPLAMVIPL